MIAVVELWEKKVALDLPVITLQESPSESPGILDKLIELAQFALAPERKKYLQQALNAQREALAKIEEAIKLMEAEGVPESAIMTHGIVFSPEIEPPLRDDVILDSGIQKMILNNAPQHDGECFLVPPPKHEQLETVSE